MASNDDDDGMIDIVGYKVDFMDELGRGTFGTVFKGYTQKGSPVAVKRIRTSSEDDSRTATNVTKFQELKDKDLHVNDHILTILDVEYQQNAIYIFMEICDLGDLNDFFAKYCERLDTQDKVRLMRQIIDGISFLHDNNIVHRDIKPANILLTSKSEICGCRSVLVKISDFDLIKILDPDSVTSAMSSNVGSLAFKAPEFFSNNKVKYRKNVDVYAAGLTFAAMLQAHPGTNLMPKVEGVACSIGLAAHNRMVTGQSDIVVVEDKESDSVWMKKINDIIRGMTHASAIHRLSASKVCEKVSIELFVLPYTFHIL